MDNCIGQQVGNYRLIQHLGRGNFADVYVGEHIHLNTLAAIKMLHTALSESEAGQFRGEARMVARLVHPNIIRVLDFGIDGATPFLVMEYAPNGSLRKSYPHRTQVPLTNIVSYVKQIADALQYAHEQKLIHRDVKPENILLGRNNEVVLSDFGLAIIAQPSHYQVAQVVGGTAAYMAPEQFQGKPRAASDQYSLGIVVYEWLCGECPFQGLPRELYGQQLFATPPSLREKVPTILPRVEEVIMMALAKDPKQRFGSVKAFATALEQACGEEQPRPVNRPVISAPSQPLQLTITTSVQRKESRLKAEMAPMDGGSSLHETIDTHEAVKLFHQFMQPNSQVRILRLMGEAKMGKSHLVTKVFPTLARQEHQARCAILDLRNKMQTISDILQMALSQLDARHYDYYNAAQQTWTKRSRVEEDVFTIFTSIDITDKDGLDEARHKNRRLLAQFISELNKLDDMPSLLLFDSVNNASESMQTWLMDTFLVSISLLKHVRVVVAGRSLPEAYGSYTAQCRSYQLLPVAAEEEYIDFCKRLNVGLAEQSIRDFAYAFDYKPGMFVDYVLPKFAL